MTPFNPFNEGVNPVVLKTLTQIRREPKRANALIVPDMDRARWFLHTLRAELGADFSRNENRIYLRDHEYEQMPPFTVFVLGAPMHLGQRVDGLMLVDMINCGWYFFRRNYLPVMTPGARWEAIKSKDWSMDTFDWHQEL